MVFPRKTDKQAKSSKFLLGVGVRENRLIYQRESNMHRFEDHQFASRFAPHFLVGGNSGFMLEILCT